MGLSLSYQKPQVSKEVLEKDRQLFFSHLEDLNAGFFELSEKSCDLDLCQKVFERFQEKKQFVQIGIGGSALGPQMLIDALGNRYKNKREFFFFDNVDPDYIQSQLQKIKLKEAIFYVVSKSGGTVETAACLSLVINQLLGAGVKKDELKHYFVFCTDPNKSLLKDLAHKYEIQTLSVPENIGGRFSVLSPVGILPALFASIPAEKFFQNHQGLKQAMTEKSELFELANFILQNMKEGKDQTVLMPYSSQLKSFSSWFVQLWAESLGKKENLQKERVYTGLTPIAAYGASDQHAQVQLFNEGPNNKLFLFIGIEKFQHQFDLSCELDEEIFRPLRKVSMEKLLNAQLHGTTQAIANEKRPTVKISIPELSAETLGELILFFESLTASVGSKLGINTFNQPGVEAGKKYAKQWLS